MNVIIGVYDEHEDAVAAIMKLKENGYDMQLISLLGKAGEEIVDKNKLNGDGLQLVTKDPIKAGSIAVVTLLGSTIGLLTGAGLFLIPGLGLLYGAGPIVGAIAGFDVGLLGGSLAAIITANALDDEYGKHILKYVDEGKYVLLTHEDEEYAKRAKNILQLEVSEK